jgi:uncharacterized protein (DUF885 family)
MPARADAFDAPQRARSREGGLKPVWAAALALGLAGLSACGPRASESLSAFDGRVSDWTREILADSPELATQAGVSIEQVGRPYSDRLDDRSALAMESRRGAALRRLAELRGLDTRRLEADDKLTFDILQAQFEAAAGAADFNYGNFAPLGGVEPYVLNQLDSAFLTLPEFLERRHEINTLADADAYLSRLNAVADAIDQETERARADDAAGVRPPLFIIDAVTAMLDDIAAQPAIQQSYVTALRAKLAALIAAETDQAARERLETRALGLEAQAEIIVRDQIIPAHQRAAAALRNMRARATEDAGAWRLPQGDALYRASLRVNTTTDLTPDQIHQIGLTRVAALNNELDIALRRVGLTEGPVGSRLAAMTADPRYVYPDTDEGRAQLIADVRGRVNRVLQRAPQWFGRLPRAPLEVRPVPTYQEAGQPGAFYSPPSLDGRTPGIYYINLRNLAEMTRIDLPTQDYHEAAPGHHFQIALAQEQTQIPLLRRLISFNAYSEGWGLYAEELADELGFHENDPVGRIGYLRWQLWRAARLVVDTGLHAKRWPRQQAIDYLTQTTGDAPGVIATEVDRYIVWPGQACSYEIGRREIARLREHARTQLGPDFDLRGFHDSVLLNGEVPLTVLDTLVEEWIPVQRRAPERERPR